MDLIAPTDRGLYCEAGDFHIDPWRPVSRAVITHAHADHARFGSDLYVCHPLTAPILKKRLGDVAIESADYGEVLSRNGVEISLHPAGHVLGSAQVRVAHGGEVWVASGDYKTEADGVVASFEPQRCNVFITESTFALPIYRWRPQSAILADIESWWRENGAAGRASVLYAYALGKAQRVLAGIDASIGPIVCHGAVEPINAIYREAGVALPPTRLASEVTDKRAFAGALIVAPPIAAGSPWLGRFGRVTKRHQKVANSDRNWYTASPHLDPLKHERDSTLGMVYSTNEIMGTRARAGNRGVKWPTWTNFVPDSACDSCMFPRSRLWCWQYL